jgi:hypothetical protein
LQCPFLPTKLFSTLLDDRDIYVHAVQAVRLDETVKNTAVKLQSEEYNGRKDMYLSLSNQFLGLSVVLVERDILLSCRSLRASKLDIDINVNQSDGVMSSVFLLQIYIAALEEDWERLEQLFNDPANPLNASDSMNPSGVNYAIKVLYDIIY